MALPTTKMKEALEIKPRQTFEGHTKEVWGAIHLRGGERIITCSHDGSLRVWNLKSGKQIGEDWRDGKSRVQNIALSPDGKKVVSGSWDGAVRLWDIDTCKVIAKWTGHTKEVWSVCWSRDGRRVLSGSSDGTARQWDVESGKIILAPIETGHYPVYAVVYSPDMALIATAGRDGARAVPGDGKYSIKIWDAKTGEPVATLEGHTWSVYRLAWTVDGKTLISGSVDHSIRTWSTKTWKQIAIPDEHTSSTDADAWVWGGIALSPNGRILASAGDRTTTQLWNLDNGQPISSPLQHADTVRCVSFSVDGKLLATGCDDKNAYIWDVAAILREAGLVDLLSKDPKANKSAIRAVATRRPPAYQVPQGFFDDSRERSQFSARSGLHSSEPQGSTLLGRLFHRGPSNIHDTSPSSPLKWAQALLEWCRQRGEDTELQGPSPPVVEVPYAKGKRRNACAREKRERPLPSKRPSASNSRAPKPNARQQSSTAAQTQPSSQPHAAVSDSSAVGDNTAATSSTPSRPDVMHIQAGLWARVWLFIGCLSPEDQDGRH